jgi:hypothetical protein
VEPSTVVVQVEVLVVADARYDPCLTGVQPQSIKGRIGPSDSPLVRLEGDSVSDTERILAAITHRPHHNAPKVSFAATTYPEMPRSTDRK